TVTQNQPVGDNIMYYQIPTKMRFYLESGAVDRDITIESKQTTDFSFPLDSEPNSVRFDPELTVMARVTFPLPEAMMIEQAKHKDDVVGRLLAERYFQDTADEESVSQLGALLKNDSFYGVRVNAARALGQIRTDQAFDALMAAREQSDPRAAVA